MQINVSFTGGIDEMQHLFGQLATLDLSAVETSTVAEIAAKPEPKQIEGKVEAKRGPGRPPKTEAPVKVEAPAAKPEPKTEAPVKSGRSKEQHAEEIREYMQKLIGEMGAGFVVSVLKEFGVNKLAVLPADQYEAYEAKLKAGHQAWLDEKAATDALI